MIIEWSSLRTRKKYRKSGNWRGEILEQTLLVILLAYIVKQREKKGTFF